MAAPAPLSSAHPPAWVRVPTQGECINSAAISGDGSVVVAGTFCHDYGQSVPEQLRPPCSESGSFGTFFYDAAGNQFYSDSFTGWQGVVSVAISRDGSTGASCGWLQTNPDTGFISAYAMAGANTTRTLQHKIPGSNGRGNMVALSNDGSVLAAGADQLYIFTRDGASWSGPTVIAFPSGDKDDYVTALGISGDGTKVAAITANGYVLFSSYANNQWSAATYWQLTDGEIHAIAMSNDGSGVAAGATTRVTNDAGGAPDAGTVFYFYSSAFAAGATPSPAWSAPLPNCNSCRAVALSEDATCFSAAGGAPQGLDPPSAGGYVAFGLTANRGMVTWFKPLRRSPNSTSLDSAAQFVTVSDGFPDPSPQQPYSPGNFYVFNRSGDSRGIAETSMMNWPMQISADASGIVGGSDSGRVFYWKRGSSEGDALIG